MGDVWMFVRVFRNCQFDLFDLGQNFARRFPIPSTATSARRIKKIAVASRISQYYISTPAGAEPHARQLDY